MTWITCCDECDPFLILCRLESLLPSSLFFSPALLSEASSTTLLSTPTATPYSLQEALVLQVAKDK